MSKNKQRSTSKAVAGKHISSKSIRQAEEPPAENNMMAGILSQMKAAGLNPN
jgi:hypothetical protein